jgi:hypothetical protein
MEPIVPLLGRAERRRLERAARKSREALERQRNLVILGLAAALLSKIAKATPAGRHEC